MRKLIVSEFMSLDGVIEEPMWTFPYWTEEIAAFKFAELFGVDDLLLGRVTYEGFAQAWPNQKDEQGYADRMNNMPKHLVSMTMDSGSWNNTRVIGENVADEIASLKAQDGQDILIFGSGRLTNWLMEQGLIDQYNLLVYPITLGKGQKLFVEGIDTKLKLIESKTFSSGVVAMIYQPAP